MSGIAGIYYRDQHPVDSQPLRAMTEAAVHRGPDGVGHWVQGSVAFGHLQLCTTPESLTEQQPLVTPNGNYAITCDGRVDNRRELIQDLRSFGAVSDRAPDAALVLQAYLVWGTGCLDHITGDFAFALWDGVKRQVFCARDRLGIRPFYYYCDSSKFIFGSEINSLLQHPGVPNQLNEAMVGLYLSGGFSDGEQTFYRGIQQLPAGQFLLVNQGQLSKQLYWELEPDQTINLASDEEYVHRFHELFEEAVRCRLRSPTPVAVTLSGGLDSSSIFCTAGELLARGQSPKCRLRAFSLEDV
jgi:asparagine synthase (glutamine-hydrolysing)